MNREEFYVLNSIYNASLGRAASTIDSFSTRVINQQYIYRRLIEQKWIDDKYHITSAGMMALSPYKVDNAVILAAGSATRFIPLSLEQPKALYEVKGERLIDRQIKQLHEAGIRDITVVIGYKHESFNYLEEVFGVKTVFNPLYNIRNNTESLFCVKNELKNTYICVCDSYFVENPFNQYELSSFYAGYTTVEKKDEMYAYTDSDKRIIQMEKAIDGGLLLLGHTFWNSEFSRAVVDLMEIDRTEGKYFNQFWEWMIRDNLKDLPPYYVKEYEPNSIFEFDYFEQLREFDNSYEGHTHSDIIRNIKLVFRCDEEDVKDFRNVNEGLTNRSFIFNIDGIDYIYRHPGDGTDRIINRKNEKQSLLMAYKYGIDPTYIYMDTNEGWKISKYVTEFREPDYSDFSDSKKVISVLRKLHELPIHVDYGLRPWEDAAKIEIILKDKNPDCFEDYELLKNKICYLHELTERDGVEKCFCHGDTYRPNWMIKPNGETLLIDWEYSGFSDPGIDVGYYIVDAMYDEVHAKAFIKEYLQKNYTKAREFHFLAYTAIIAYYWFVWALYRESCGAVMGESLNNWRTMAEKYVDIALETHEKGTIMKKKILFVNGC